MQLPIDFRKTPIRNKYLTETFLFADWYIFGEGEDGVDIACREGDIIIHVPKDVAEKILEARANFCNACAEILG
jgi:hypothetical protein